jgi:filamentous hemagglutinin family protein
MFMSVNGNDSPICRAGSMIMLFQSLHHVVIPLLVVSLISTYFLSSSHAQVTQTPGAGSLNTQVNKIGNVYEITHGTQVGSNLFHSFETFSVGPVETARFQTINLVPDPAVANVLGRVTGGTPSNILGAINSANYYPNANLFLMNPAGFLFGPNATVNVGGMVSFTSADYLKLADNVRFNAIPNAPDDALLTASPVATFGFLGSNPGAITVQGSRFTVTEGTGISLVGGDITVQSGILDGGIVQPARLAFSGGQINLASIASAGEVSTGDFMPASGMTRGSITLAQGATLDVSGNAAGTVRIRGGEFVMAESTISADTTNADGAATAIDIKVSGNLSIVNDHRPAITARTSGTGNAGEVIVSAASLTATSSSLDPTLALIDTRTSGEGQAGRVTISTGILQVEGGVWFIDSGTAAAGNGNDVTINATTSARLNFVNISTGDFRAINQDNFDATGFAGNIRLTADSLELVGPVLSTDSFLGRGGDITLEARTLEMTNGLIGSLSLGGSGAITVAADSIRLTQVQIEAETAFEAGRDIVLTGATIELRDGTSIRNQTSGNADAGNILVTATDHLILSDQPTTSRPTGFYTNSLGVEGEPLDTLGGRAGSIMIETPRLEMSGGARINTSTETSGRGGDVTITTTDLISISGERRVPIPEDELSLGATNPGGIFTRTVGSEFCSGPCGDAGQISITTGSLTLNSGARVDSGTASSGQGGAITINATDTITLSGTLVDGKHGGVFSQTVSTDPVSGNGGNIALTAGKSVTISDGASVSASSTGPGNTGNIQINAGDQFAMTNSTVTTEANQAGGGTIKITTTPSGTVQLTDSKISASVLDGTGGGGSVNIDPQYVILLNSQILAKAVEGPGGKITINITNGGLYLPDANSTVSATSQFGVNGTVTIQSPNDPAGGKIQPLGKSPLLATSLLNQRCAALAGGEFSSFTVAGRDSLPTEPGNWLASPLALGPAGLSAGVVTEGGAQAGVIDPAQETTVLSLRQIAPAGFLTQAFALDWSASCKS